MKKTLLYVLSLASVVFAGCNYLDVDPETGLDENQVFTTWNNFKAYFNNAYEGRVGQKSSGENINIKLGYSMYIDLNSRRFTWYTLTDMADAGRWLRAQQIKAGALGANVSEWTTNTSLRPISYSMFRIIRVCNKCIANIDMVQNAKQEDKDDIIGQAYFVRAFAHFTLCRIFGGMPYLDKALEADDNWDMTRLSSWETYVRCAEDLETAYDYFEKAGKIRRDPGPGSAGHLSSSDMAYPNGVAAKALRARCLLYAASELNNRNGKADWEDAAAACGEALLIAQANGYEMLPFAQWSSNFWGAKYTNEHIWAWDYGSNTINSTNWSATFAYPISNYTNASGDCPTQNFVDRFETLAGDPLRTEAERREAAAAGNYNEQDPYSNRDPRLDKTIIHDGSIVTGCTTGINIYYDPDSGTYPTTRLNSNSRSFGIAWSSNDQKGYSNTGYYCNKWWNGILGSGSNKYQRTDPLIRMAELYLNYAEAVNEAYGPQGVAGGCSLTALAAVNEVRKRAGMPDVQSRFTGNADLLRERIRNERCVELAFEGHHYYHDIRRWKIAPQTMTETLMGMYIEKTPVSAEYPRGRRYIRRAIPANRQANWKDAMYYLPFPPEEANKMKNFVNNEIW